MYQVPLRGAGLISHDLSVWLLMSALRVPWLNFFCYKGHSEPGVIFVLFPVKQRSECGEEEVLEEVRGQDDGDGPAEELAGFEVDLRVV